jgi:outer membrane protein assembly factor BamB
VYVSSSNAVVYALDATTGQQFWSTNTGDQLSLSSPTVANGVVYYGTFNDNVWAFDASTGEKLWSYKTGRAVNAKPTVVNGKVYVGSDNMYAFGLPG